MAEEGGVARWASGLVAGRLAPDELTQNFGDLHPPLDRHEAAVEAARCYFCHDAPCITACPTSIDIPLFIRQIDAGNRMGAAKTIFDQNILGGICARVCPTESLCEEACVREAAEGKPVKIGLLQRYATDAAMAEQRQFYRRASETGKGIAVIGAGPAGLACAHRLAMNGHGVTIYDSRPKAGGLNEYGIAAYKTVDGFAQAEVDYVTAIGGIEIVTGQALGRELSLAELAEDHDAVFLGMGLAGVNALETASASAKGADDAIDFIAALRQAGDLAALPVGRRVVVIGGGMTAIDAAVQAKLLGAEEVTLCYRRGQAEMRASRYEQELAAARGVVIRHWLTPRRVLVEEGKLVGIELDSMEARDGRLVARGETVTLAADQILRAIGQTFEAAPLGGLVALDGRIATDEEGRTSMAGVWAGGDCTHRGEDLTVTAVAQGRDAAESIHRALSA